MEHRGKLQQLLRVYVLDTSALTDTRIRNMLGGGSLDEAIRRLAQLIAEARIRYGVEVYMPPTVYEEARRFLIANGVSLDAFEELVTWITVKPPARHSIMIPASIVREYVEEVRARLTRGLRVAEEHVKRAFETGSLYPSETTTREERREKLGALIKGLRERFREATRHGMIDSVEDIDAVLLAVEVKGILVSNDDGVRRFAEELGVVSIEPMKFVGILKGLVLRREEHQFKPQEG